jgi:S-adenosylmethionine:tRNA ribosyltransferase-isomerase
LPKHLIAQTPAAPRNNAKLLVYDRRLRTIVDDHFYNLEKYLLSNTTLVLNDSKVEKSRLNFGSTEVFVLEVINPTTIRALVRPGKKFKKHTIQQIPLFQGPALEIITLDVDDEDGVRTLSLSLPVDDKRLDEYRLTPLPPYIGQNEALSEEYQTVYAKPLGSKAAPTAGLHFTNQQLEGLAKKHSIAKVTLHIGMGTFAPVKVEQIKKHKMHSEQFYVNEQAAKILNRAESLTAVGTTSLRVLETTGPKFQEVSGSTDIFITPGYEFKTVDSLITNFHLPKSTLLMLVAAFIGSAEELHRLYKHGIDNEYRFYSFGDAMLII